MPRSTTSRLRVGIIYGLYRVVQWLGFIPILLYLLGRSLRDVRYLASIWERFGFLPSRFRQRTAGAIWVHAVSVGEILTAVALLRRLRAKFPLAALFVSCSTLAGRGVAEDRLKGLADGVFYAPLDFCFAVRRVLRTIRPGVVVVLETELWPGLFREVKRAGCGLLVVNGRISDRTAGRYRRLRLLFREVLSLPDAILAQSELNRERFIAAGAPPVLVSVGGNLKYDVDAPADPPREVAAFVDRVNPEHVWICASTMPPAAADDVDEDDMVLEAFSRLARRYPRLLLILAPRRPERFSAAASKLRDAQIRFVKRSRLRERDETLELPGALLLDSIGELNAAYALATVVFMGGTVARRGGHNILEPAVFSKPVVIGPHMENFEAIAARFIASEAVVRLAGPEDLAAVTSVLLDHAEHREALGARAGALAESERGAAEKALHQIGHLCARSLPVFRPPLPWHAAGSLLSHLWAAGSRFKRRRHLAQWERLNTPVVSIGGITLGGAGKTPFVAWLTGRLRSQSVRPAILTRGYRRKAPEAATIAAAGEALPTARTGDEAQIYLRQGLAPVGIGADRCRCGRQLEERFQPDLMLLDDGFQHWRLHRDLDIVLIDALDPFGNWALPPLGRLREPLTALERADIFVITRGREDCPVEGIKEQLRRYNPRAPVFRSWVAAECWVEEPSGYCSEPASLAAQPCAAFCSLANPMAFWRALRDVGIVPAVKWTFHDHHRFLPYELKRMARHAAAHDAGILLTTQKDLMNLPAAFADMVKPLRLYWLKVRTEVEDGEALCDIVRRIAVTRQSRPV